MLHEALGGMRAIRQWFIWRLTWDAAEGKYQKYPVHTHAAVHPMDSSLPPNWRSFEDAEQAVALARTYDQTPGVTYALGFRLTADCGYWFLDMDKCIADGAYSALATEWVGQLPGCLFEFSSSGTGVHVIGRGAVPEHSCKNSKGPYAGTELYTDGRGIAFGLTGQAWGSADVAAPAIATIAALAFPPRLSGEDGEYLKPRDDWAGPTDDAELIRRALASKSTAAKFGTAASFADLWTNDTAKLDQFYGPETRTERDAALAAHLAFWTGCDAPRMERLMRASGLVRDKWHTHKTYLRELTIANACAMQRDVCKDSPRVDVRAEMYGVQIVPTAPGAAPAVVVTPEMKGLVDSLLDMIHGAPDWSDIHNRVIPTVAASGVPRALMPPIENAINERLDLWNAKLPVAQLRALINPPKVRAVDESNPDRPEWAAQYVYVRQGDAFHSLATGVGMSRTSFNATHDRHMPFKGDGAEREDSVKYMLHQWDTPLVHDTMYYPGQPTVIDYDGLKWANLYTESTHPVVASGYTERGHAAITQFSRHLWALCGQREKVYQNLLCFMAHNVQFPGKKIRWVPIIKGTEGDGKSLIGNIMDAAMGGRNVITIGPEIVAASGGFTDWAHGNALTVLEELYMEGAHRHRIVNAIKQFISNNKVTINQKGSKPKKVPNTANQIAFTNHNDAVPITWKKDRRWFVVFTPYDTLDQMNAALGFATELDSRRYFDLIFDSVKGDAGEWRKWLLEMPIPEWFSADGRALETAEKEIMANSGINDIESIAADIIREGCHGVSSAVLSSACLTNTMRQRAVSEGIEIPKTTSLHHMLNRMGFVKVPAPVKWLNAPHRIWARPGIATDNDNLRQLLQGTVSAGS